VLCQLPTIYFYFSGIDLLQDIPLDTAITETTDHGKPIVIALPNSTQVKQIEFIQDLVQILNYLVTFVMFMADGLFPNRGIGIIIFINICRMALGPNKPPN
jgi:hypothetical protein